MNPARQPPEALFAHREWVRNLARRLVADDATAEEVSIREDTVPKGCNEWTRPLIAVEPRSRCASVGSNVAARNRQSPLPSRTW
jgi:hypothetical protein